MAMAPAYHLVQFIQEKGTIWFVNLIFYFYADVDYGK